MTSHPSDPPDPAFSFAFAVQESFELASGGIVVVSAPGCQWAAPSAAMKTMLRTPDGRVLESAASFVHTTPNFDNVVSLCLHDLTKADVPSGSELFVRLRRTPKEQDEALRALDKLMDSNWTNVEQFSEFPDAQDFHLWINQQLAMRLAEEVPIKKAHRKNKSGEHWYRNTRTDQVWRYLETILPSRESFELLEDYSTIDKIQITIDAEKPLPHAGTKLPIRVWINDRLPFEDDYTLDIGSFFAALDQPESVVSFIGGCGIAECCAVGFRTHEGDSTWKWQDFEFSWESIYEIANQLVDMVESLPSGTKAYDLYYAELHEFCRKRDTIKLRLSG